MFNDIKQFDGILLATRYAFMPNRLRYCGGNKNSELFEYAIRQKSDDGLKELLKEFETMYPYLRLIAESNRILDPFNYKVVEAYWLGNELLENVSMKNFYHYLIDEQKLKKKFKPALLERVFGKIPQGAKPHHSFHVFNIPKRTGHYPVRHTLETMDKCRIAAGRIRDKRQETSNKYGFSGKMIVEYEPLMVKNNKIEIGKSVEKEVWSEINQKAFVKAPKVGDWVSIHWGWICDILTPKQVENLNKWTKYNLALTNL